MVSTIIHHFVDYHEIVRIDSNIYGVAITASCSNNTSLKSTRC